MLSHQNNKGTMPSLILTFFLDNVGLFMVVPIYAPLLLTSNSPMFSPSTPYAFRTISIGLLVACYGIGQLIGGPILGELSDQFGRKKIILIGLTALIIGNLLGAFSLFLNQLWLLFFCRLLTGFASGNWSVIFATTAELSQNEQQRNTYLGYLTGAASLGAVTGPIIGAHFSNSSLVSWFTYSTPFLIMAIAFFINMLFLLTTFNDTGSYQRRKLTFFTGFYNIYECFQQSPLRIILISFFFFSISTESIFAGLPIFVVEKFKVNSVFIGNLIAAGSLVSAFSSIYLNKKVSALFNSHRIFFVSMLILMFDYFFFFIPSNAYGLYIPYCIFGLSCILVWTHANSIISDLASPEDKGKVLGAMQSLLSLAIILGPSAIGIFAAAHYNAPILISAIAGVLAFCFFIIYLKKKMSKSH